VGAATILAMKHGVLIAVEGIDGSGKSTQVQRLAAALRAAGHDVVATREPSVGPFGQRIRAMVHSGEAAAPEEELRWFLADREQHVREVIEPALAAGKVVITDRYFLSTAAYQGARGLGAEAILKQCEERFPLPDLALVLDVDPALGLARARSRGAGLDGVFEREEYLERVAGLFRGFCRPYLEIVAARASADSVYEALLAKLRARLGLP